MPLQVTDVAELQAYLRGVVKRADHHADNIRFVVLPLVGAIVLYKDPDAVIKVMTREGEMANVLWVHIGGLQYAFSYDHKTKSVVMKRGNTQGDVLAQFTNQSTIPEILSVFEELPG